MGGALLGGYTEEHGKHALLHRVDPVTTRSGTV
jgi:hypothetical protein